MIRGIEGFQMKRTCINNTDYVPYAPNSEKPSKLFGAETGRGEPMARLYGAGKASGVRCITKAKKKNA